ncbi:MAG: ketopantoate reductase family protein [Synergistaceae bacterium]|nr:ketopantoate reductase family protein [Synergistaceae bacterium]
MKALTRKIETVALIGLGAMGCAYLSKIAETFPMDRIRVVASGDRAERYRANGVTVNGRRIRFPIFEPGDRVPPADLLIFTVKHNQLGQAICDARGQVGPDTVVISLLNGITSEIEIGEAYGAEKVLCSLAMGTDPIRAGDDTTFTTLGTIPFGEAVNREGEYSRNVLRVEEFFKETGLRYEIPEDMTKALWKKFMMNVGVNQVTAVLRCGYGALLGAGLTRDLAVAAMTEVTVLAEREKVNLTESDIEDCLKVLGTLSPQGKTSTLQDVEARRQTEVDIFGGTVVNLGRKHGVPVPVNEMLFKLIKATEESYPHSIYP